MLFGIENYAEGSQNATVISRAKVVLPIGGTGVEIWAASGSLIPVVLGLVGTIFASADSTATDAAMQVNVTVNGTSYVPATFNKNVGAGLSIKVNESYGQGWADGIAGDNVTMRVPNGYSGEMIWSGFVLGRWG